MPNTVINTPREVEEEIMLEESPRNNNSNTQKPSLEFTGALSPQLKMRSTVYMMQNRRSSCNMSLNNLRT